MFVQEPCSSPDLLRVQDRTEQYALAATDDKFRALLVDQPQIFALIFSIARVPPRALTRVAGGGALQPECVFVAHYPVCIVDF